MEEQIKVDDNQAEFTGSDPTEVVQDTKTYLNKQNRNTLAAFKRSRSKIFHDSKKHGTYVKKK